jgi:kynurenine formamidase
VLTPEFPLFPGGTRLEIKNLVTYQSGNYYVNRITFDEHSGTHMDAYLWTLSKSSGIT